MSKPEDVNETSDVVNSLLDKLKHLGDKREQEPEEEKEQRAHNILTEFSLDGIADYIKKKNCKKIVVATGAGISTSAGIPDFRSPGTGLYNNLKKYNLPKPESIFDVQFFKENPMPFHMLAKELFPTGKYKPTYCHYFIKLLADKGLLLRNYTQNIDTLERLAGIDGELLVEAHGSFAESDCIECHTPYPIDFVRDEIFKGNIVRCSKCSNLVKPKIVFFGESLPERFFSLLRSDFDECDLLIVIGTSLKVNPFARIVDMPKADVPRLLINLERVGEPDSILKLLKLSNPGFDFDHGNRDVFFKGTCDDGCTQLAKLLGFEEELIELKKKRDAELEESWKEQERKIQEYQKEEQQ